jgi:hypothetical protein
VYFLSSHGLGIVSELTTAVSGWAAEIILVLGVALPIAAIPVVGMIVWRFFRRFVR